MAREAARILYNRSVKEYKDAKEMAASSLGSRSLPSNYEVARELDRLSDELEGSERPRRLIEMRKIAQDIMRTLRGHAPVLIGSVWRGTARLGSDIDIVVYHSDPSIIGEKLGKNHIIQDMEHKKFTIDGLPRNSVHINFKSGEYLGEVVVRPPEEREAYQGERCETYGDLKRGITLSRLEKLMSSDPLRRFIPKRRKR